jgi:hypothetical protein
VADAGAPVEPSVRLLLELWREPARARAADERDWDGVVRVARATRLLAALGARLAGDGMLERIPPAVRAHVASEQAVADHRAQMARRLLGEVGRLLDGRGFPVVLLKGAAYLMQRASWSRGRLFADVDLLVPRAHLAEAERLLHEAGWRFGELDAHDERYYREWSHELPPLEHPAHPLQLDLHHSILPPVGRARPDVDALFAASVPVAGTPFRALSPADQALHACAHVFQDSDFDGMLRDLADVDALLRERGRDAAGWSELAARARRHGLGRALWYGAHFGAALFATPVPAGAREALAFAAPGPVVRRAMSGVGRRVLLPESPDRLPSLAKRGARRLLTARYFLLRLPPRLLAVHVAAKARRALRRHGVAAPTP